MKIEAIFLLFDMERGRYWTVYFDLTEWVAIGPPPLPLCVPHSSSLVNCVACLTICIFRCPHPPLESAPLNPYGSTLNPPRPLSERFSVAFSDSLCHRWGREAIRESVMHHGLRQLCGKMGKNVQNW